MYTPSTSYVGVNEGYLSVIACSLYKFPDNLTFAW